MRRVRGWIICCTQPIARRLLQLVADSHSRASHDRRQGSFHDRAPYLLCGRDVLPAILHPGDEVPITAANRSGVTAFLVEMKPHSHFVICSRIELRSARAKTKRVPNVSCNQEVFAHKPGAEVEADGVVVHPDGRAAQWTPTVFSGWPST
jgi:hypothetical protein